MSRSIAPVFIVPWLVIQVSKPFSALREVASDEEVATQVYKSRLLAPTQISAHSCFSGCSKKGKVSLRLVSLRILRGHTVQAQYLLMQTYNKCTRVWMSFYWIPSAFNENVFEQQARPSLPNNVRPAQYGQLSFFHFQFIFRFRYRNCSIDQANPIDFLGFV